MRRWIFISSTLKFTFVWFVGCSPRVAFCGYSVPHPSDNRINVRVQTTGERQSSVLHTDLRLKSSDLGSLSARSWENCGVVHSEVTLNFVALSNEMDEISQWRCCSCIGSICTYLCLLNFVFFGYLNPAFDLICRCTCKGRPEGCPQWSRGHEPACDDHIWEGSGEIQSKPGHERVEHEVRDDFSTLWQCKKALASIYVLLDLAARFRSSRRAYLRMFFRIGYDNTQQRLIFNRKILYFVLGGCWTPNWIFKKKLLRHHVTHEFLYTKLDKKALESFTSFVIFKRCLPNLIVNVTVCWPSASYLLITACTLSRCKVLPQLATWVSMEWN